MQAIKLCRLDTPIIFIEARINFSRFVATGCAAKTSATLTFPSLNLVSLFAFCFLICLHSVASQPILCCWVEHCAVIVVFVRVFLPKLRRSLSLNGVLGGVGRLAVS